MSPAGDERLGMSRRVLLSTLTAGHTSGTVAMVEAPAIDGATTVGVRTDTTTVVEGGTETHSHADTFTAYLDGYVAYVTVVTDPGSSEQPLDAGLRRGASGQDGVGVAQLNGRLQ